MAEYILKQTQSPPCVMINKNYEILYIHGKTGKYLELAQGKANMNILKMAHPGLRKPIVSAMNRVIAENKEITQERVKIRTNRDYRMINLSVGPVFEPIELWGLILVKFEELIPVDKKGADNLLYENEAQKRLADMEFQLISTKEDLQMTIEELESSNEELRSTNEELQSTNEELQSTNEELETSKEEMQSMNEESQTMNTELQRRIEELTWLNNDMRNLLDSTEIANIFLDMDLCIRRFTPRSDELVDLMESDIGRSLSHFAFHLKYYNLIADAKNVLDTLNSIKKEVESKDGEWYSMRIIPYRTMDNKIDGVVITFLNITEYRLPLD